MSEKPGHSVEAEPSKLVIEEMPGRSMLETDAELSGQPRQTIENRNGDPSRELIKILKAGLSMKNAGTIKRNKQKKTENGKKLKILNQSPKLKKNLEMSATPINQPKKSVVIWPESMLGRIIMNMMKMVNAQDSMVK